MRNSNSPASRLLAYINRVESIEAQIAELKEELKGEFGSAKSDGFSVKAIKHMIIERRMTPDQRKSWQATLQAYRAALGMLDGTPLGDEARKQFFPKPPDPPEGSNDQGLGGDVEHPTLPTAPEAPTAEEIEAARQQGAEAAQGSRPLTDNPYRWDDARRAAFDEGWCQHMDSDGMDIPEAFRPKDKRGKKGGGDSSGAPANDQADDKEAA